MFGESLEVESVLEK